MTAAEKLKQIRAVIEAGCNEVCEYCDYSKHDGSVCDALWGYDQIARIVGVDV